MWDRPCLGLYGDGNTAGGLGVCDRSRSRAPRQFTLIQVARTDDKIRRGPGPSFSLEKTITNALHLGRVIGPMANRRKPQESPLICNRESIHTSAQPVCIRRGDRHCEGKGG